MTEESQQAKALLEILMQIQKGMPVYDGEDIKLGEVSYLYWGVDSHDAEPDDFETLISGVASLPIEVVKLFRQEGCIRVDTEQGAGSYFLLPYQIAYVTEEGVFLLMRSDELVFI